MIIDMVDQKLPAKIKLKMAEKKVKQRELYRYLINNGVEMSETKLSNRLNGINSFLPEELKAINKFLKTSFSFQQ